MRESEESLEDFFGEKRKGKLLLTDDSGGTSWWHGCPCWCSGRGFSHNRTVFEHIGLWVVVTSSSGSFSSS